MADTTNTAKDSAVFFLAFILKTFADIQEFLSNQSNRALLDDEDAIKEALAKLGHNETESARLTAKLKALIDTPTV